MSATPVRLLSLIGFSLVCALLAACGANSPQPPNHASATTFTFSESGVYRLPPELTSAGGAPGSLFAGERELPIWQTETDDGPLSFFYVEVTPTRASEVNALFWQPNSGATAEMAVTPTVVESGKAQTLAPHSLWREENSKYHGEAEMAVPWLWERIIAPGEWQDEIILPAGLSAPYSLTVRLWAQTEMPVNPDHHIQVMWDGLQVGDESWDGAGVYTITLPLPDTLPGRHILTIKAPGDTGAVADVVWVDGWGLTAQQQLDARQGPVVWQATADAAQLQIQPGEPIWLLDITDAFAPQAIGPISPDGSELIVATQPGHRYWAGMAAHMPFTPVQRPRHVLAAEAQEKLAAADYIAVGAEDFLAAAQPLLAYRQDQGLTVATLTPVQLVDTWGAGVPDSAAWSDFLAWRRAQGQGLPAYMLLLGDAELTPWAGDARSLVERVPTAFVRTFYIGETPSDAALLGDAAGTVAVGRIPAQTTAEVAAVVEKTLAYERNLKSRHHLILNDNEAEFDSFAANMAAFWQQQGDESTRFDAGAANVRPDLLAALQQGSGWLHYVGHGSPLLWAQEQVLTAADAAVWDTPAVVFAWTCLSGYFVMPENRSLAEAWLLSPRGGAVAVIAPTAEDITPRQQPFADEVYRSLTESDTFGAALTRARSLWQDEEIAWQYHLFGDPALMANP